MGEIKIKQQPLPGDVRTRLELWVEAKIINWKGSSRLEAEEIIKMVEGVITGQILPPAKGSIKPWEKFGFDLPKTTKKKKDG